MGGPRRTGLGSEAYTERSPLYVQTSAQSMSQLPLFAQAREAVLVDDARGRIVYTPDFLPPELARAWFDEVHGAVAW